MAAALNLLGRLPQVTGMLRSAMDAPPGELAPAGFAVALIEYPSLDAGPSIALLDRLGAEASRRIRSAAAGSALEAVRLLSEYLYDEEGFRGNEEHYDDLRNSFLNEVLERRVGIPISLAVVYLEVARRAGVQAEGVNFPGHFLLRVPVPPEAPLDREEYLVVDPFHGGAVLGETDCRELLRRHAGEDEPFDPALLRPATRPQIVTRMLVNMKRLYVRARSFPQARLVSELLLTLNPASLSELRDRGLLAYHVEDFTGALRDLEAYLRLSAGRGGSAAGPVAGAADAAATDDGDAQIRDQVETLRRRVAEFN